MLVWPFFKILFLPTLTRLFISPALGDIVTQICEKHWTKHLLYLTNLLIPSFIQDKFIKLANLWNQSTSKGWEDIGNKFLGSCNNLSISNVDFGKPQVTINDKILSAHMSETELYRSICGYFQCLDTMRSHILLKLFGSLKLNLKILKINIQP